MPWRGWSCGVLRCDSDVDGAEGEGSDVRCGAVRTNEYSTVLQLLVCDGAQGIVMMMMMVGDAAKKTGTIQ